MSKASYFICDHCGVSSIPEKAGWIHFSRESNASKPWLSIRILAESTLSTKSTDEPIIPPTLIEGRDFCCLPCFKLYLNKVISAELATQDIDLSRTPGIAEDPEQKE